MYEGLMRMLDTMRWSCDGCPRFAVGGSRLICLVRVSAGVLLCDLNSHELLNLFTCFDIVILELC